MDLCLKKQTYSKEILIYFEMQLKNIWLFSYRFALLSLLQTGYFDNQYCFEKVHKIQELRTNALKK